MNATITHATHILPKKIQSSESLEDEISSNSIYQVPAGIIKMITGIESRHVSEPGEYNSTLASQAALKLFKEKNINPSEIDLLIFASAGQDTLEPGTAHIVQSMIDTSCPVFDITNACNSFLNALEVADALISKGSYKKILIATGEVSTKSARLSVTDRSEFKKSFPGYTFGDIGAAVLMEPCAEDKGIIASKHTADSSLWKHALFPGGGSRFNNNEKPYFEGSGSELKKAFDELGPQFIKSFLKEEKVLMDDISHIFTHQVSLPYLKSLEKSSGFDENKVTQTIISHGNVAAGSLPLAWSLNIKNGALVDGDLVLLVGLAGGISLGLTLIRI